MRRMTWGATSARPKESEEAGLSGGCGCLCGCYVRHSVYQGLTLVPFSGQLEPCLTHVNTLHTLYTPLARATQPLRAPPILHKALKLS